MIKLLFYSFSFLNFLFLLGEAEYNGNYACAIDFYISSYTLPCIVISAPHIPYAVSSSCI